MKKWYYCLDDDSVWEVTGNRKLVQFKNNKMKPYSTYGVLPGGAFEITGKEAYGYLFLEEPAPIF